MLKKPIGIREVIALLNFMGHDIVYREAESPSKTYIYITRVDGKKYLCESRSQTAAREHLGEIIGGVLNGKEKNNSKGN